MSDDKGRSRFWMTMAAISAVWLSISRKHK
jgi:hypothetical protein